MKTKKSAMVTLVASVVSFVAHEALAFYNLETGAGSTGTPLKSEAELI